MIKLIPTNCRNVFAPYHRRSLAVPGANTPKHTETNRANAIK